MQRIFLVGYMGSGKTAMGKLLAKQLGFAFVDLDNYIEGKFRRTIAQIFEQDGEDSFRAAEQKYLHEVAEFDDIVVATGGGAPCFFDNMDYMNENGTTIYLKMDVDQLLQRLLASKSSVRPLISNKSPEELKVFVEENLKKRERFYGCAKYIISGSDEEIVQQINQFKP